MTTVLELSAAFLRSEDIALAATDLRYGLAHGYIKPQVVIEIATDEARRGSKDPALVEIADLLSDEADRVAEVLEMSAPRDSDHPARKWLYLELKAAYLNQDRLPDPLGLVEELYAEFDYPADVARFVRYMPILPDDEPGVAGLMRRWSAFLEREHAALLRSTSATP